jgi:Molybdopterin converting factor, small subunit
MIRVRLFAAAAEAAGTDAVTLPSPTAAGAERSVEPTDAGVEQILAGALTLAALRAELVVLFGEDFARVLNRCAVLVDGARLADDDLVPADATVDVLPPFAGG